jgi:glyceraldehyde 3-phosphate dehydrogenase
LNKIGVMMAKVAINGLGRIGRATLKIILDTPELELVAANDLTTLENVAYLIRYDTVYHRYEHTVLHDETGLTIKGKKIQVFNERDPMKLPWRELGIDIVFECTGAFTRLEDLEKHIHAGARNVILSAPTKSENVPTIVHDVNVSGDMSPQIRSCASCTTNCITPIVEIMGRRVGIAKAIMTTIHAYTSSQSLVDEPNKSPRRGRAGATNFVPTSTGAAIATTKALPQYRGLFDGVAVRAPVPVGSIADIVFLTKRKTTADEINSIFKEEAQTERYRDVLGVSEDPIVSSDIIKDSRASIIDAQVTQVVDGDLVKVMSWYDNEWGYSCQMVREAVQIAGGKKAHVQKAG